jgi:2-keto-4-pentenoate hydratase/2-oxohepta-3-ene-1,7-dioic acid hydratase in catechol pathway
MPGKIVAIGLNYIDHASESKMELPKYPLVFTKFNSSITGPFDPVIIPSSITDKVDYEVELAVVIGRLAKNVAKEEALKYVFGYTIINDVSARNIQFDDGQWVRGKSLDTFCPMGPFIVTADEIKDPQDLHISCSINNNILQDASTADMIFGVADLISKLSHSFSFQPGDIIATGTPSGVGFIRKPPVYLQDDDVMETVIEGIGKLINKVKVV